MYSEIEENYLKAIFKLSLESKDKISTSAIARELDLKSASVTDMVQRMSNKDLIYYKPYKGVELTAKGRSIAVNIIRKHRLWEVFLAEKLHFKWSEVHDLAEQLEHVQSDELIDRLDNFLGNPTTDPHGGPIPDKEGKIHRIPRKVLSEVPLNTCASITGVKEDSNELLQFLEQLNLLIGTEFTISNRFAYDNSLELILPDRNLIVSEKVAENVYVRLKVMG